MEKQHSYFKARLGVFVTVGFALLVGGIFLIGRQKHLFNPVVSLHTAFRDISGLEIGAKVRFSGINVGAIENIHILNDTTVKVDILVDKDVQKFIKSDSYVKISSDGIIGDKIVNITQGSVHGDIVKEGQFLPSIEPLDPDAIISSLKSTGENANVISSELAEILYKVNHGNGTIGRLLHDTIIAENIDQTILNLKRSSKGLDENMEAAKHNILLRGFFKDKKRKEENKDKKSSVMNDENNDGRESWRERRQRKKQEKNK